MCALRVARVQLLVVSLLSPYPQVTPMFLQSASVEQGINTCISSPSGCSPVRPPRIQTSSQRISWLKEVEQQLRKNANMQHDDSFSSYVCAPVVTLLYQTLFALSLALHPSTGKLSPSSLAPCDPVHLGWLPVHGEVSVGKRHVGQR